MENLKDKHIKRKTRFSVESFLGGDISLAYANKNYQA
jgi:hypothetical protein